MDAEADQLCGGGANSRNGYRERGLATCVVTLSMRSGSSDAAWAGLCRRCSAGVTPPP